MEITGQTTKTLFSGHVSTLLEDMQASYDSGTISRHINEYQSRLDKLASTYQHNESLGRLRYKLYEAQAYLHYFTDDNEKALEFIDEAIRVRGGTFRGAESLKDSIMNSSLSSSGGVEPEQQPINGWLAFLVFSLGVGALYNVYEAFTGWSTLSGLTPDVEAAYPNIRTLLIAEQLAPILAFVLGIMTIVLILQRKRLARAVGISFMAGVLLWYAVDYSIASNMFANNAAALSGVHSAESSNARFVFFAIVWLLYLAISKKAKATLIK